MCYVYAVVPQQCFIWQKQKLWNIIVACVCCHEFSHMHWLDKCTHDDRTAMVVDGRLPLRWRYRWSRWSSMVVCHYDGDIDDRVVSCWARHNHAYTAATTIAIIDIAIVMTRDHRRPSRFEPVGVRLRSMRHKQPHTLIQSMRVWKIMSIQTSSNIISHMLIFFAKWNSVAAPLHIHNTCPCEYITSFLLR